MCGLATEGLIDIHTLLWLSYGTHDEFLVETNHVVIYCGWRLTRDIDLRFRI